MQSWSDSTEMGHENPSPTKAPAQGHKKIRAAVLGYPLHLFSPGKVLGGHSLPREVMGMEGGTFCKDGSLGCAARVIPAQLLSKGGAVPLRSITLLAPYARLE